MAGLYLLNHSYICSLGWLIVRTRPAKGVEGNVPLLIRFFRGVLADRYSKKTEKNILVPVLRPAILVTSLDVVVALAQRLPVASIPEQRLISTVRDDVIYHRSLPVLTLLHAPDAQRMGVQVFPPRSLPRPVVATVICRPDLLRMEALVLLTEPCSIRHKSRASRMLAGGVRTPGHQFSQGRLRFPKWPRLDTML